MDDLIIYNTDDGQANVSLFAKDGTVWCTQAQMAELFGRQQPTISKHIANILNDGELDEKRSCEEMRIHFFTAPSFLSFFTPSSKRQ